METNETSFSSYYHQHRNNHNATNTTSAAGTSPTNGLLPTSETGYPNSIPSSVTTPETVRRKRGRPRKYETPEQGLAARKAALAAAAASDGSSLAKKKGQCMSYGANSKKPKSSAIGDVGRGFTPHMITVAAGEDVTQKIMLFMQQSTREICILSASGSISNASLRQPTTSGGITYEGLFEITSLSGSYVSTENGGRTGGLSICLSSADGQIVGGSVGGPLKAASPVQVIVSTFVMDTKKDVIASIMGEPSYAHQLDSQSDGVPLSFIPIRGSEDLKDGTTNLMLQPRGVHRSPSPQNDWTSSPDS